MNENKHIGIYGIAIDKNKLLVIKKSRGPYRGKYDLPGGGIEFCENLIDALHREFSEEIGAEIEIISLLNNADFQSEWIDDGIPTKTHHIGLYYKVKLLNDTINTIADGHDSDGALWIDLDSINEKNLSPIALKVLQNLI